MATKGKVGIIGSGLIGRSWAMIFAAAGYRVTLYDTLPEQLEGAMKDIEKQLRTLEETATIRGDLSAKEQFSAISLATSLKDCVSGAFYLQENVPEDLDIKRKVFLELDELVDSDTILASSTSCIMPSQFTATLKHKHNCIVSHPTNPPYYVPMVEVVPAPWTSPEVVKRTKALMEEIGQSPVTFSKEIPGFGSNRLQYALLNQCWHLVSDGILSANDVDTLMRDGLGMRYAFMGPLETALLNAEGFHNYCERYGETINSISQQLGPVPSWKPEDAQQLTAQLNEMVPVGDLTKRRAWRNERLIALSDLKKQMKNKDNKQN